MKRGATHVKLYDLVLRPYGSMAAAKRGLPKFKKQARANHLKSVRRHCAVKGMRLVSTEEISARSVGHTVDGPLNCAHFMSVVVPVKRRRA